MGKVSEEDKLRKTIWKQGYRYKSIVAKYPEKTNWKPDTVETEQPLLVNQAEAERSVITDVCSIFPV